MSYVILSPALIAPRSRVANKLIPMCIEVAEGQEYILSQFGVVVGAIKDVTIMFRNYAKTVITNNQLAQTLLLTLGEVPFRHAITVKYESADVFELDKLFDELKLTKLTTIEVENVRDLAKKLISLVATKYRTYEIRPLPHVLVYSAKDKILTRVCWTDDISGKVDVYVGKQLTILHVDKVSISPSFVETLDPDKLEEITPITVPELVDKVTFTEKLMDVWNRELSKVRRSEAKRRALEILTSELEGETARTGEESEGRVET